MSRSLLTLGLPLLAASLVLGCSNPDTGESSSFGVTSVGDGDGDPSGDGDGETGSETGGGECGNSVVEVGEQCDLGPDNAASGSCTPDCQIASCGDGYLHEGFEDCDDGNPDNTDDCVSGCVVASCGDGFVHEGVEQCDDANTDNTDACSDMCVPTSCGDGVVQAGEQCDDGNADDTDECPGTCQLAYCGDGFTRDMLEECDDGNMLDDDGCVGMCTLAFCGDGFLWTGMEDCDDNNTNGGDACTDTCTVAFCGDGVHWQGMEDCDDGNNVDDDGCANDCTLDVQYNCHSLLISAPNTPSGVYLLDPDGPNMGGDPYLTYCDMTTDGGGWTLILNRVVDSDQLGQPDLDQTLGNFDPDRATNFQFNIDAYWAGAQEFAFADKENADCPDCDISDYDSAISVPKPAGMVWSKTCNGASSMINVNKLAGPNPGATMAFQCTDSLGWGSCGGSVCHYGTHTMNTANDGTWSQNGNTEMHFPSAYSNYKQYGNVNNPPSAWCRSCGGGLTANFNMSSSCCQQSQFNARSRWTLWVR